MINKIRDPLLPLLNVFLTGTWDKDVSARDVLTDFARLTWVGWIVYGVLYVPLVLFLYASGIIYFVAAIHCAAGCVIVWRWLSDRVKRLIFPPLFGGRAGEIIVSDPLNDEEQTAFERFIEREPPPQAKQSSVSHRWSG
jgi:hypothetical protein